MILICHLPDGVFYFIHCPHCQGSLLIKSEEVACQIFRHATYKENGQNINPHSSKDICDRLILENKVYGCTKPFRFDGNNVSICDYI